MVYKEFLAIEFGAAVDERRNPVGDQIAAEIVVVEYAGQIQFLQRGDGRHRRAVAVRFETMHRRIDKSTPHQRDHGPCNQHAAQRRRRRICNLSAAELLGKRRCEQKRREQRQNFGSAPLGERHVQQSEQ